MTGFSRTIALADNSSWVIEARSVNGRGLDIKTRQPNGYEFFERMAREIGKAYLSRGQVSLVLSSDRYVSPKTISINRELLGRYLSLSQELTDSGMTLTPSADGILGLKGVIELENTNDDIVDVSQILQIEVAVKQAFLDLVESRESEGRALAALLSQQMSSLTILLDAADSLSAEHTNIIRDRFRKKLEELAVDASSFEDRIIQEISIAAIKADIKEEIDRLRAHIAQAIVLINEEKNQGRKLDFLSQEFMREANTLCSKSASISLTRIGLDIKMIIDQFREQCQNIE